MTVSHEHIMEELSRVNARLEKGGDQFQQIIASQSKMEAQIGAALRHLEGHGQRITVLEASDNVRKGERSVWAGILSSKAFAWLAAGFTACVAWISHNGTEGLK